MPIYEYKCTKGHIFEAMQSMSDDTLTECEVCGAPVQRVFHPVAIHFKGKGFHNTDYGTRKRNRELKESAEKGADAHDAKTKDKSKGTETSGGSSSSSGSSSSGSGSSSSGSSGSGSSSAGSSSSD